MGFTRSDKKASFFKAINNPLACFLAAFRFLTILPLAWKTDRDGDYFQGSLYYFTLIGALIGLFGGGLCWLLGQIFPPMVVSVLAIIFLGAVSGFLHLDGLADTSDGFFSSRPKERILEIMRDSRTGAMGVVAIVLIVLLKFSALSSLNEELLWKAVLLMPIGGRAAIVFSMAILPYARQERGLGAIFYSDNCFPAALWAIVVLALCTSLIGIQLVLPICGTVIITVLLFSLWCKRVIGGATGDTLGALCEITEMSICLAMTCLYFIT